MNIEICEVVDCINPVLTTTKLKDNKKVKMCRDCGKDLYDLGHGLIWNYDPELRKVR
jgi:hypothetical protein